MTGDVGKIYADALFELCVESDSVETVHTELNQCCKVFNDNPELVKLLSSPVILNDEKKNVINSIFGNSGTVHDFICLVTDKKRISFFDKMTENFNIRYNNYKNIAEMTVITSIPLKKELCDRLIKKLEEKSGKTVKLTQEVDPAIIGGLILKQGNTLIDNSVRGRLEAVAKQLKIQ